MGNRLGRLPAARSVLATAIAAAALSHGNASAISLEQAYQAALLNDPGYRMAIHGNEAGQESRNIGRS